jgi:cytochrome c-type biogenesis protein CcmE
VESPAAGRPTDDTAGTAAAMTRRRRAQLALAAVTLAGVGLLVAGGLRDTVTYYRTPGEVLADPDAGHERVRLGGQVIPGSLRRDGGRTLFRLAAGGHEITVVQRGAPPDSFREGEDAVVEGVLGPDRVFQSDTVLVRHGNEYRAPTPAPGAYR